MRRLTLTLFALLISFLTWTQSNYPISVVPGQRYTVAPKDDTLWIITDNQFEKAIIAAKELENADKQIENYQKQIENLNEQLQQTDTLLMQTQENLEFYRNSWQECSENLKVLVKENDRVNSKLKITKIVGVITTIAAFRGIFILNYLKLTKLKI